MEKRALLLLADADILIHFYRGGKLQLLPKILPYQICIIDAVAHELNKAKSSLYGKIKHVIGDDIIEIAITDNPNALDDWYKLVLDEKGEGESACMALAKHEGHHIASSNLRDVRDYCKQHNIRLYTTMDLIHEAYSNGLMTRDECDAFIKDVRAAGSKLPCKDFTEYLFVYAGRSEWTEYDQPAA